MGERDTAAVRSAMTADLFSMGPDVRAQAVVTLRDEVARLRDEAAHVRRAMLMATDRITRSLRNLRTGRSDLAAYEMTITKDDMIRALAAQADAAGNGGNDG